MSLIDLLLNSLPEALGGMITAAIIGGLAYLINKWRLQIPIAPNKILHNLPRPDFIEFVGRTDEFLRVIDGLIGRSYLISIDGVGGIGKTALALETGHRLLRHKISTRDNRFKPKHYYDSIIWFSAKKFWLSPNEIVTRKQETQTLQDLLNTIAITLGKESYLNYPYAKKIELIRAELTKRRSLLIIDNLESVDDELFFSFLRELPEPTKALITTRHQIGETYRVRLPGLSERDAFKLMRNETDLRSIILSVEHMIKLYQRTGGIPLAIVWTIARMEYYKINEVLTDIHTEDYSVIAHFCFHEVITSLKKKESYQTLLALSLFSNNASREAIGFVTGFPPPIRDATLVELERLCLINKSSNKFWMLPLTREFATKEINIIENIELKERVQERFASYYNKLKIESVHKTKSYIKAVHLATEIKAILAWDDTIADYLDANREAINRGVKVSRIFVLNRSTSNEQGGVAETTSEILNKQTKIGVNTKILWVDEIKKNNLAYPPDMIIFDNREVHLHKGSGGWYTEVEIIDNNKQIEKWIKYFTNLEKYSEPWQIQAITNKV